MHLSSYRCIVIISTQNISAVFIDVAICCICVGYVFRYLLVNTLFLLDDTTGTLIGKGISCLYWECIRFLIRHCN